MDNETNFDLLKDRQMSMFTSLAIIFIGIAVWFVSLIYFEDKLYILITAPRVQIQGAAYDFQYTFDFVFTEIAAIVFPILSMLACVFGIISFRHHRNRYKLLKKRTAEVRATGSPKL